MEKVKLKAGISMYFNTGNQTSKTVAYAFSH